MPPAEAPWGLRLRDGTTGTVLGTGFLIAPRLALTCWHVVEKSRDGIRADFAGPEERTTAARPSDSNAAMVTADVAILNLDEPGGNIPVAPMGPAEPPAIGTVLAAFGFPSAPAAASVPTAMRDRLANPGMWAQVMVDGFDMRAERLQLTSRAAHGMPVRPGFSGGPVVDPNAGLVVGMLVAGWEPHRMALMIPVRALAACSPVLREILRSGVLSDREFTRGLNALNSRNYPAALTDFRAVCARRPEHPDTWFYVALAALRGQRPRTHFTPYIEEIGQLLEHAASLSPSQPHVLALWAILKEDHHRVLGLDEGVPGAEKLRRAATSITAEHAAEICDHVPAPETPTWRELQRRRAH